LTFKVRVNIGHGSVPILPGLQDIEEELNHGLIILHLEVESGELVAEWIYADALMDN
jgi:hypothetical protein